MTDPQIASTLYALREALPMFTVYDHPTDHPDFYVARLHLTIPEPAPTTLAILHRDLGALRRELASYGLVALERDPSDDPCILETWL
jgi:hypothetical protein